jgi:hypothetical protein
MTKFIFAFFIAFIFLILGAGIHGQVAQREAVKQGHAEYFLDADFQKQWRWKTNCVQY